MLSSLFGIEPKPDFGSILLEGFSSGVRIGMFPYAPVETKIKLSEHAVTLDHPYCLLSVNLKMFSRRWIGDGRADFILVQRIARIMLDLFPPIPSQHNFNKEINRALVKDDMETIAQIYRQVISSEKEIEPITKIYQYMIAGLEHIQTEFFPKQSPVKSIPKPKIFDFKYEPQKYTTITEPMAAEAVAETIAVLKFCYLYEFEPVVDLLPIQEKVKKSYTQKLINQFANGLDLIRERQGNVSIKAEWLCKHEFNSLDHLVLGQIESYEKMIPQMTTLVPEKKETANNTNDNVEPK